MKDKIEIIVAVIVAVLSSGLIQFLITLFFSRHDKSKEIEKKIDALTEKVDENAAVLSRTHILRFSDEIRNGVIHSSEYWRQQLDDCDTYARFCEAHPDFRNSYTTAADQHIKDTYDKLIRSGEL